VRQLVLVVLASLVAVAAAAQWEPPNAPPRSQYPDTPNGEPFVYFAHGYRADSTNRAGLDDRMSVHVQNFNTLLAEAHGDCRQIVMFIDGLAIRGMQPESCDKKSGHVRYRLHRTEESDEAWHALLGSPHHFYRKVSLSIGADPQFSVKSQVGEFELEIIPSHGLIIFSIVIVCAVLIFLWLCIRTSLIRSGSPEIAPDRRPFSLSLFQMAFWFFLVVAGYVFVWLITDELNTITASVLALIGIGAATAMGSALIDSSKPVPVTNDVSQGFMKDVLSDREGISLHRFQMFVWTIVLGIIFVVSVYRSLEMPEFSATLLGLMGISSGTYLGFKVPENKPSDAPAGTTPSA
jgi:hypothetical protein